MGTHPIFESDFDCLTGLNEKYEIPKSDDHFLKVLDTNGTGIRLLKQEKIETLFAFICSSNNNIKRISAMVTYLSTKGKLIYVDENKNDFYQFPTINELSVLTEEELRKQNFGYRAKYIVSSVGKIVENGGEKWIENISQMEYSDSMNQLLKLTGIGR